MEIEITQPRLVDVRYIRLMLVYAIGKIQRSMVNEILTFAKVRVSARQRYRLP